MFMATAQEEMAQHYRLFYQICLVHFCLRYCVTEWFMLRAAKNLLTRWFLC